MVVFKTSDLQYQSGFIVISLRSLRQPINEGNITVANHIWKHVVLSVASFFKVMGVLINSVLFYVIFTLLFTQHNWDSICSNKEKYNLTNERKEKLCFACVKWKSLRMLFHAAVSTTKEHNVESILKLTTRILTQSFILILMFGRKCCVA